MERFVFLVDHMYLVPRHLSFLWLAFTTCCVNMATPIHFINSKHHIKYLKAGKSRKTCLTNHTWPISHHITILVINGLGSGHSCKHTDTRAKAISRNQARAVHLVKNLFSAKIITVKVKVSVLLNAALCICPLIFITEVLHLWIVFL